MHVVICHAVTVFSLYFNTKPRRSKIKCAEISANAEWKSRANVRRCESISVLFIGTTAARQDFPFIADQLAASTHRQRQRLVELDSNLLTYLLAYLIYCTPIADVNSTDVPVCRHSTRLWAWSSSSPLIFLQNTRCSTHTYHSRWRKFCCRRTARVEQFTGNYKTDHQLRTV